MANFTLFFKIFCISTLLQSVSQDLKSQVELVVRNDIVECGEEFTAEIYANNFNGVQGVQFTLAFDEDVVEYLNITTNLPPNALFNVNLNPGKLLVTYATFIPVSYPDGTLIFEVEFNHLGDCGDPFIIHFVDDPLAIELSDINGVMDFLIFGAVFLSSSDCNLEVDAGEDFFVCEADLEVTLSGDITGDHFDFFWRPDDLVFPQDQLTTSATVPETTTFTLTGRKETENIVYNDHFDFGYVGFYSDYEYNPNDLSGGNAFAVANSPDAVYTSFPACSDHTGNNGNMLIVNGMGAPPQNAWCQYIEVEEGTTYVLGAFINTLTSLVFPQAELQFQISGDEVGDIFDVPDIPCFSSWVEMHALWTASESGTINFCIFNHQGNVSPIGNGFVIDDISFVPLCEVVDELEVEVKEPAEEWIEAVICAIDGSVVIAGQEYTSATEDVILIERPDQCDSIINIQIFELELNIEIELPGILSCENSTIELDASSSTSGPEVEFIWSTSNGNIVSGQGSPIITVDQPGVYTLILHWEDDVLSCFSEEVSIEIMQDVDPPNISLSGDTILNCYSDFIEISVEANPPGAYDYLWTTPDGNITGSTEFFFVVLDAEGTYFVEVTNSENGCSSIDSIIIGSDFTAPIADAGPDLDLNCIDTLFVLGSNNSSLGTEFEYVWTTVNGNFTGSTDSLFVSADQEGTYFLQVINLDNGCSATDSVEIIDDRIFPVIAPLPAENISCLIDSLWIGFELLNGEVMDYTISWTTANGFIVGSTDSLVVLVGDAGSYEMEISFDETGCITFGTIVVEQDDESPVADAGSDRVLTCLEEEIELDGSNSSTGASYSHLWTTSEGNIINGQNGLSPLVNAPGWYFIEVVNNDNGCIALDSVLVLEDFVVPEILIEGDSLLDCLNDIGSLEAAVANGDDFSTQFNWSTANGNITGSTDSSFVTFDEGGDYWLEVTFSENGCTSEVVVEISVDKSPPAIDSVSGSVLTCADSLVELTIFPGSQQSSYLYIWNGPAGGIEGDETGETISVVLPGWYFVVVTDQDNGCENIDSVLVEIDLASPEGQIFEIGSLNCIQDEMQLLASIQPPGEFAFEWSTVNGNIVSGGEQNEVTINNSGTYILAVTNIGNACTETFEIEITADLEAPVANAGVDTSWTCADSILVLDGGNSSFGPDIIYSWTAQPGSISGSNELPQIEILGPGTYILEVTNQINGCTSTDTVAVSPDEDLPSLFLLQTPELNCQFEQGWIGFEVVQDEDFSVIWNTSNGEILSSPDSLWLLIGAPGDYTVSVTFSDNNCTSVETVIVDQDIESPLADAGPELEVGCDSTSVLLDGSNSSEGPQFSYIWSTTNGNIVEGDSLAVAMVDQPGLYTLSVFNSENSCFSTDSVLVISNDEIPEFTIEGNAILSCVDSTTTLNANLQTTSLTAVFEWFYNGNSIAGPGSLDSITVSNDGIYSLVVTFEENQCNSEQELSVILDSLPPTFDLMVSGILSCLNTSTEIVADTELEAENYHFQWETGSGPIANSGDPESLVVDSAGTYFLLLTQLNTGCFFLDSITVVEDISEPEFTLLAEEVEGCGDQVGLVELIAPSEVPYGVEWSTLNGSISGSIGDFVIQVDAGGVYYALVLDTLNGCSRMDSATITWNVAPFPIADAGANITLNCSDTLLSLNGGGSDQGAGFSYSWTSLDGNFIEGANSLFPTVNAPGTYVLEVVNLEFACSSFDTTEVIADADFPYVEITSDGILDCATNHLVLDASSSDKGIELEAVWQGTAEFVVLDSLGYLISVVEGGEFLFQLTNKENGCSVSRIIVVEDSREDPIANGGPDLLTGCLDSIALLMVPDSAVNGEWIYSWEALEGRILSSPDSNAVVASPEGIFVLQVIDPTNNCQSFDTVLVNNNSEVPFVNPGPEQTLSCSDSMLTLDGSLSDVDPHFIVHWTSTNGHILSGDSSLNPIIDAPGTYLMTITNPDNGCSGRDSLIIGIDTIRPVISAGENLMLDCQNRELNLSGTIAGDLSNFIIEWTSVNGTILAGEHSLRPLVNREGTYIFSVTSFDNGCAAVDSMVVNADFDIPVFGVEGEFELNCLTPEINLRVDLFSAHDEVDFALIKEAGDTVEINETGVFSLDQTGAYLIEVIDRNNRCRADTLIRITGNFLEPEAGIECIDCDPCGTLPVFLIPKSNPASNDSLVFNWIFEDGYARLLTGDTLEVFDPSIVYLEVFNPINGCSKFLEYTIDPPLDIFPEFTVGDWDCNSMGGNILFNESEQLLFSIDGGSTYFSEGVFEDLPAGIYPLRVRYIESGDCESEILEVEITDQREDIEILLPEAVQVQFGEAYSFNPVIVPDGTELVSINWEPAEILSCSDCLKPVLIDWPETTEVRLMVVSPGGCEGDAVILLNVAFAGQSDLFVPTAFSPNDDGVNDRLYIHTNATLANIRSMEIFDRWGSRVFQRVNFPPGDPNFGWDGTFRDEALDPGVFVIRVIYIDSEEREQLLIQDIVLIR